MDDGLEALGLRLSAGARAAIDVQARLLFAWNQKVNLTALRDPELVARRHVLDSLSAVPLIRRLVGGRARERERLTLLDLGSGAGYPGLPLAVALPAAECALVDSVAKKARFLSACAAAAQSALSDNGEQPPVLAALAERAEDLAEEPEHRERWRIVVARAVGTLAEVVELTMPLVVSGGHVVAWKRDPGDGSLDAELAAARLVTRATGGGRPQVEGAPQADRLGLPGHVLVTVPKLRPTPYRFPRPPAERRRALT